MRIPFYKYQGTGNDFIMLDNRAGSVKLTGEQIAFLCRRRFGIGADGLILLEQGAERLRMVYFNSDGGESTMCGNGGRCFARFAEELGLASDGVVDFDAVDGFHRAHLEDDRVVLQMMDCPPVISVDGGFTAETGSPHFVAYALSDFWDDLKFTDSARAIRNRSEYVQRGINVNFICETTPGKLRIRTFERGVEDETYSCGTGVTAAALVYGVERGISEVLLESKGGGLAVSFRAMPDGSFTDVFLKGPARKVFEGTIEI
jgi:diaminopimelate epimerase